MHPREHIISKKDGFLTVDYCSLGNGTGYEDGFLAAENNVLRDRQFSTGLDNPSYNLNANETKEIQKDMQKQKR
ncbi:hypothetical protein EKK58_06470 [Candidatus Dependentiae bacterium]|nr:MAG: hypothetical protein EKK58_06470 [Candidatus Dependentiae bacterium]